MPSVASAIKIAIYARCSTVKQDTGIQVAEVSRVARERGWTIYGEYVDKGVSGAKASRPALDRLMEDARMRRFDAVLVLKIDRFGRSLKNLLDNIQALTDYGVRFIAVSQGIDTDQNNAMGRLVVQLMAAFAEFERAMINDRSTAGLAAYKEAYANGTARESRSKKNLPIGRPSRVFDRALAREMRSQGHSWPEIGRALGVPAGTVRSALRRGME